MRKLNAGWTGWLAVAAMGALLAACGASPAPSVSGVAQANGPVVGRVTVVDASATPVRRTAATAADGSFTVDTTGMTPPYLLKVEGSGSAGAVRLFSASADGRSADVNPITSAAFSGARTSRGGGGGEDGGGGDDDAFEHQGGGEHHQTAGRFVALLTQLKTVLAPLLERYGIADPAADRAAVRALLQDVRFAVSAGVLTVTNRATGAVIFTGPLADLASGTFDPGAMPAGPGTGGGGGGTGGGTGAALYAASCASCHGPLATSQVRGASLSDIQEAIAENEGGMRALAGLPASDLQAIAAALSGSSGGGGGGTTACTYTYSAFGACTNGTQTRTVLTATPSGCTGTPVLTQACGTTIDGAALYTQYCSGCHGNSKKGSSASSISSAISSNRGGMGTTALRALTAAQIAAISAAP